MVIILKKLGWYRLMKKSRKDFLILLILPATLIFFFSVLLLIPMFTQLIFQKDLFLPIYLSLAIYLLVGLGIFSYRYNAGAYSPNDNEGSKGE